MTAFAIGLITRGIGVWVVGSINVVSLFIAYTSFSWQGWALGLMVARSYREGRERAATKDELLRAVSTDNAVPNYRGLWIL